LLTRIDIILSKLLTGIYMMHNRVGGRGRKAPYQTTHVRVPEPIKAEVERLIADFHQDLPDECPKLLTTYGDAIAIAQGVLTQKKSARVSMQMLLTALYKTKVELK
jgi:hypothetical protein